jgi:transposase
MMGRQPKVQKKLFYTKFNLDQRVPKNHILRKIAKHIDFVFVYNEVRDTYGVKGNVSVPAASDSEVDAAFNPLV